MKILFRTSGGKSPKKELGLGHVYRSLNLATNLTYNKRFFLIEDFGGVKKIIKNQGFENIFTLKKGLTVKEDTKRTLKFIKERKIDIVIIDKLHISKNYIESLKKESKIVVISDLWGYDYPADLVVKGFVGYENKIIKNKYGARCLLGPLFHILNKKFVKKKKRIKKRFDLLATFGGFDEQNLIDKLLVMLEDYLDQISVRIILGPSTKKSSFVKKMEKKFLKNLNVIQKTDNMAKEISQTKYGICAGGNTTYEFAYMNIPFAILCQVNHQLITARIWEKKGIAINLGKFNEKSTYKITDYLERIIQNKVNIKNIQKMNNYGKGRIVVADEILKLVNQ